MEFSMPALLARVMCSLLLALVCAAAQAQPVPAASTTRGQMLYDTHCIACHTAQMHWRDDKQATDWASLKAQVRRWQATAGQFWNEDDIVAVSRHLNDAYYRFPQSADAVSWLAPATR
jgi:mono/diheme cytochrome c family protein